MANDTEDEFAFLDGMPDFELESVATEQDPEKVKFNPKSEVNEEADLSGVLLNPLTGSMVNTNDIDSLILGCLDAKQQLADLRSFEDTLRRKIGSLTTGDAKTRRVRGKTLQAKVEMPDEGWDQTILKEAWQSYPQLRDEFLKIGTVNVQKREFKKMLEMTSDDPAFKQFSHMLKASVREATGAPTVSLEEIKGK